MLNNNAIFLDYQASTPLHEKAMELMKPHNNEIFANPHSNDHILGWQSNRAIENARRKIADSIGADKDEIIFTSGATEANNLAVKGLAQFLKTTGRTKILSSATEHKCILASLMFLEEQGFEVDYLRPNHDGVITIKQLQNALDEKVGLVTIMAVNNEIGTIQAISQLCEVAHSTGAFFHTDAAQAPVFMALDVNELGVDMLSLSSHKAYGPKGIGALFVRREIKNKLTPILHGGGQEDGLRSGTLPTPLCVGFGEALFRISANSEVNTKNLKSLTTLFWNELKKVIPEIELNGAASQRHPGNLNIRFPGLKSQDFLQSLQPRIAASTGSACNSGVEAPSYVLDAIGLSSDAAAESIRFSFGLDQSAEEIMAAVNIIHRTHANLAEVLLTA